MPATTGVGGNAVSEPWDELSLESRGYGYGTHVTVTRWTTLRVCGLVPHERGMVLCGYAVPCHAMGSRSGFGSGFRYGFKSQGVVMLWDQLVVMGFPEF